MTQLEITNRQARWLWLESQGLSTTPTGPVNLRDIVDRLGVLQLDTIRVVARAHDHILWSRNQNYREPMLHKLHAEDRAVFEHFSHDACLMPIEVFPYWTRQFRRMREKMDRAGWLKGLPDARGRAEIRDRIAREGPLSSHAFDTRIKERKHMWQRPPHKLALDYMWHCGELTTSHRENFVKFYDLTDRVIPETVRDLEVPEQDQLDFLHCAALDRLAFGSAGEIQRFWDIANANEVKSWLALAGAGLVEVRYQGADKTWYRAYAPPDIEQRLADLRAPTSRLRILNPFDPVIRDRARLLRLFGFDYRIEVFVPASKRRFGYYVYPILEGDRMVGRIEVKADRKANELRVQRLWAEPGIKWTGARADKLAAELQRMSRFVGCPEIVWMCGAQPEIAA
nr:crosslink repair DNA glycosylase YcaQ family protein [Shimia biformata]